MEYIQDSLPATYERPDDATYLRRDGGKPMSGAIQVLPGSQEAPGLAIYGDERTGLFQRNPGELSVTLRGWERLRFTESSVDLIGRDGSAVTLGGAARESWCGLSAGTGDDYQISSTSLTSLSAGLAVVWKADRGCGSGPVRLELNALGLAPLRKGGSYELSMPDIVAGEVILCVYDGAQWNAIAGVGDSPIDGGVF